MLYNTKREYGSVAKFFHWTVGLIIIALVIAGMVMSRMDPQDLKWTFYGIHKATGVVIMLLILARFFWMMANPKPELAAGSPAWQKWPSKITHWSLYALMFVSPISGFIMSNFGGHPINIYGLFTIDPTTKDPFIGGTAHSIHEWAGYAWAGLLVLHVGAALFHHFIQKDNTFRRMLP